MGGGLAPHPRGRCQLSRPAALLRRPCPPPPRTPPSFSFPTLKPLASAKSLGTGSRNGPMDGGGLGWRRPPPGGGPGKEGAGKRGRLEKGEGWEKLGSGLGWDWVEAKFLVGCSPLWYAWGARVGARVKDKDRVKVGVRGRDGDGNGNGDRETFPRTCRISFFGAFFSGSQGLPLPRGGPGREQGPLRRGHGHHSTPLAPNTPECC